MDGTLGQILTELFQKDLALARAQQRIRELEAEVAKHTAQEPADDT